MTHKNNASGRTGEVHPKFAEQLTGRILTIDELHKTGFACRRMIYRMVQDKKLPAFKVGTATKICGDDVLEYIQRNQFMHPNQRA